MAALYQTRAGLRANALGTAPEYADDTIVQLKDSKAAEAAIEDYSDAIKLLNIDADGPSDADPAELPRYIRLFHFFLLLK